MANMVGGRCAGRESGVLKKVFNGNFYFYTHPSTLLTCSFKIPSIIYEYFYNLENNITSKQSLHFYLVIRLCSGIKFLLLRLKKKTKKKNPSCPLSVSLTVSLCLSLHPCDAEIHCVINEAARIDAAGRVMPEPRHQCIATMI